MKAVHSNLTVLEISAKNLGSAVVLVKGQVRHSTLSLFFELLLLLVTLFFTSGSAQAQADSPSTRPIFRVPFEIAASIAKESSGKIHLNSGMPLDFSFPKVERRSGTRVALEFDARADMPTLAGDNYFLDVLVNGTKVLPSTDNSSPGRLLNRSENYRMIEGEHGESGSWRSAYQGGWRLVFAPDFEIANSEGVRYSQADDADAYRYVFDITDLVRDGTNTLSFVHNNAALENAQNRTFPVILQNVAIGLVPETSIYAKEERVKNPLRLEFHSLPSAQRLSVDVSLLFSEGVSTAATAKVVGCDEEGKVMCEAVLSDFGKQLRGSATFSTKSWKVGKLVMKTEVTQDGTVLQSAQRDFPYPGIPAWLKKTERSRSITPPFRPIVCQGNVLEVIGRKIELNEWGLPVSIKSLGQDLLSKPIRIEGLGEAPVGKPVLKVNKDIVTWNIATHRVSLEGRLEYDGMMWYTLKVAAGKGLKLIIPIHANQAKLFHVAAASWGTPSGSLGRQSGWRWESGFVPSIWIGEEHRGLCWFAESQKGWNLQGNSKPIVVKRAADGGAVLEITFSANDVAQPLSVEFGLQPTPVKPFPEGANKWRVVHSEGGPEGNNDGWTHYDINLDRLQKIGANVLVLHAYWAKGFSLPEPYDTKDFKRFVQEAHDKDILVVPYFSLTGIAGLSDQYQYFGEEWALLPGWRWAWGRSSTRPLMYANSVSPKSSFSQFIVNGIKQLIDEYNIDGVYLDNTMPYPDINSLHGSGFIVQSGGMQNKRSDHGFGVQWGDDQSGRMPTYDILALRDTMRQIYSLFKKKTSATFIDYHASGSLMPPLLSWVDHMWVGEQLSGSGKMTGVSPDLIRSGFLGEPWGIPSEFLVYKDYPFTSQQGFAIALPHNLSIRPYAEVQEHTVRIEDVEPVWRIFNQFPKDGLKFRGYWENSSPSPTSISDPEILVSAWISKNKAMLIISNFALSTKRVKLAINPVALGFRAGQNIKMSDAFTEDVLNEISFNLDSFQYKLILVEPK